jgi:putative NADH-flavin reductase
MKIAVIAANGRSGQAFVEMALTKGHTIRAGVYGKSYLKPHPNLEVVNCDATDSTHLTNLLGGQEAVVSFIGHIKGSKPSVQTTAMQELVKVMKDLGMSRIVSLTGTGVRFKGDNISIVDRILNVSIRIIDPKRINDGKRHVEVLQASDLKWTVIRVLKLQNVAPRPFTLLEHGPTKFYVGRKEVAQAVLQVLEQNSFLRQAPIICSQK